MNINRSNYELFVIDYLDGKLDAETVAALMIFLAANPDLQAEFDMLNSEPASLPLENKGMPGREFLKKPDFAFLKKEFDRDLAAKLEGDLSPEQEAALDMNFVLYPELHDEWALMQQSRVEPDMSVQYPNKGELKKRFFTVRMRLASYSAAAVALIAVGLIFFRSAPSAEMALGNSALSFNFSAPLIPAPAEAGAVLKSSDRPSGDKKIRKSTARERKVQLVLTEGIAYQPVPAKANPTLRSLVIDRITVMPPIPAPAQDKFYSLDQILTARLKQESQDVLVEENPAPKEKKQPELAAFAVKVFNKVTGSALKLRKKYDESGNVVGVGIASNDFEFYNGR